jgi:nucleoside-diphosphate-sugar epimerase
MKVLITGAGGFLGRAVIERVLAHGYTDVRCLHRREPSASFRDSLASRYPAAAIEHVTGNLLSKSDAVRAAGGADLVLHLAAAMRGAPADIFMNTVVGSERLLSALVENPAARIVLVSSFGVYGAGALPKGAVVNEQTPLESRPALRDAYSYAKLRQEQLFRDYQERHGLRLTVLRPGVIYGPGGGQFSARVGVSMFGVFLHFGGSNVLPLSYVDNCAEAIAVAAAREESVGEVYNVHDDELITSRQYLSRYKREVKPLRSLFVPYSAVMLISAAVERYHKYSHGQLPAAFTRYGSARPVERMALRQFEDQASRLETDRFD